MRTPLLHLLPVSLLAVAGAGAQESSTPVPSPADALIIFTADKKPAPKTSPQLPQQYKVIPSPQSTSVPRILIQPRSTMPVIQHDVTQYPIPVTAGKGMPVRIPVAPPKSPFDER